MKIDFDEEQCSFAGKVERLFQQGYDNETRRRAMDDPAFQLPDLWKTLAAQGMVGINIPAHLGGSATSVRDTALRTHIVMRAIGRYRSPEPFLSSAVVGASLFNETAELSLQKLMLPAMLTGRVRLTLAALEADAPEDFRHVATRASRNEYAWVLEGRKVAILDAPGAHWMILSARTAGDVGDEQGISLFLVSRTARGVEMAYDRGPDGGEIATATLRGVQVATNDLIGTQDQGCAPLERAMQRGSAALCSEASGAIDQLFGICSNALDGRKDVAPVLAAMRTAAERANSATLLAAITLANDDAVGRRQVMANARATVCKAAQLIAAEAVRLMSGAAEESLAGRYARRLQVIGAL